MKTITLTTVLLLLTIILTSGFIQVAFSQKNEPKPGSISSPVKLPNAPLEGSDIWMSPYAGGTAIQVTNLPDNDEYDPCWSPDGAKIAFDLQTFSNGSLIAHDIYITDLGTAINSFLTPGNDCSWSSDGSLIAFDTNPDIYIIASGGGTPSMLLANAWHPSWSPDGSMVTFSSGNPWSTPPTYIFTIPSSGGIPTPLTFDPSLDFDPVWSPDGDWIAFTSDRSGNLDIWKIQVERMGIPWGIPIQITTDPAHDFRPGWSPDGLSITFASLRSGNSDIWTIPSSGGMAHQVTTTPFDEHDPAWSPDGRWIAYAALAPATPCNVTITVPSGGENWSVGNSETITWTSTGSIGFVSIEYSTDGGNNWNPITASTVDNGSYPWIIPCNPSINCLIKVCDVQDSTCCDVSASFTIAACCACADCNNDGTVNILDALWEVNCILGVTPPPCSCDSNQDGADNILDVLCIVNVILSGSCP